MGTFHIYIFIIPKKEIVEEKLKEISETSNLSQVVLIEFAEIQKQIEKIENSTAKKQDIKSIEGVKNA